MFKKLKDKIAEQSSSKLSASVQQFAQAVVNSAGTSVVPEPVTFHQQLPVDPFSIADDVDETPQNSPAKVQNELQTVDLRDTSLSPASSYASALPNLQFSGTRSRRSSIGSATSEASSIFGLLDTPTSPQYHLQSDWESAASEEGSGAVLEAVSKEQLLGAYRSIQTRYHKYKGRYTDLARHYRQLERDLTKTKSVLATSQDKALRRISELREQCQLEQRAKAHLEEALRNDLEEKDLTISTLKTKLTLIRSGDQAVTGSSNMVNNHLMDEGNLTDGHEEVSALKDKVASLEATQIKFRDALIQYKERTSKLADEKSKAEQERDLAKSELSALMQQAANLQRQEKDASLSLAENKQQLSLELEAREKEVKCIQTSLASLSAERNQLEVKVKELQGKSINVAESEATARKELSEARAKISELEDVVEELKQSKLSTEATVNEQAKLLQIKQEELVQVQTHVTQVESKLDDNVSHLTDLHATSSQLQDLQVQLKESRQQRIDKDNELTSINLQLNELELRVSGNAGNSEKVKALKKELEQWKEETINAKDLLSQSKTRESVILEEKEKLEKQLRKTTEENLSLEKEKLKILNESEKKEKLVKQMSEKLETAVGNQENTQKLLDDYQNNSSSEVKALNNKISQLSEEINTLMSAKQYVESKMEDSCKELQENRAKLQILAQEKSDMESKYEDTIKNLQDTCFTVEAALAEQSRLTQQLKQGNEDILEAKEKLTKEFNNVQQNYEANLKSDQGLESIDCVILDKLVSRTGDNFHNLQELSHQDKLQIIKKHLECIENNNSALSKENDSLKKIVENNNEKYSKIEEEINILTHGRETLLMEVETSKGLESKLNLKLEDSQLQLENSVVQLTQIRLEKQDLVETISKLEKERGELKTAITNVKAKFKEMLTTKKNLATANNQLTKEKEELIKKDVETLKQLEEMKGYNESLQKEVKMTSKSIRDYEEQQANLQTKVQELSANGNQNSQLEHSLLEANQNIEILQNEIKNLQSNLSEVEKMNADLSAKDTQNREFEIIIQNLKSKENGYSEEIETLKALTGTKQAQIDMLQENLKSLTTSKNDVQAELDQTRLKNENTLREFEAVKLQLLDANNKLQLDLSEKSEQTSQLDDAKLKITELVIELEKIESISKEKDVQLQQCENQLQTLKMNSKTCEARYEAQLTEIHQQFEEAKTKLKSNQGRLKEIETNYSSLQSAFDECQKKYETQLQVVACELETLRLEHKNSSASKDEFKVQADVTIRELQECKKKYELQLNELFNNAEELKMERDLLQNELSRLRKEKETKTEFKSSELSELKEKLSQMEEDKNASLVAATEESGKQLAILQDKLCKAEASLQSISLASEAEIKDLKKEFHSLEDKHLEMLESARSICDVELAELREKLVKTEEDHNMQLKLVVKDYENQMARKEVDVQEELDKRSDEEEKLEAHAMRQLREQVKELRQESKDSLSSYEYQISELREALKISESKIAEARNETSEQAQKWQHRLEEIEKQARATLDAELTSADTRHKQQLEGMIKEWQFERKSSSVNTSKPQELERTSQLAITAMESSTISAELLQQQLMAQAREYAAARANSPNQQMDPALELAYLRNVLYEYMMGKQPLVLAKVIAAVAKFNPEQTTNVLQKEEQKQTLLGQIGLL